MAWPFSVWATVTGAPYSSVVAAFRAACFGVTAASSRRSIAIRSALLVREKAGKARLAAAIAARVSSRSPSVTLPITWLVAGLIRSNTSSPCGATKAPSM